MNLFDLMKKGIKHDIGNLGNIQKQPAISKCNPNKHFSNQWSHQSGKSITETE